VTPTVLVDPKAIDGFCDNTVYIYI